MKLTRRDLLAWGAGLTAGLVVTPVPWKLLDDVSIWTQNWSWIPQPARGPVEVKQSFCTLCPKGCAVRVRIAAGWPVGISGVRSNPITRGALCPLAFGAHQLNWHPQRLRAVRHGSSASSWDAARNAFAKASKEGPIVIIEGYPGRAASSVFEAFADRHDGSYRVTLSPETRGLLPYEPWSGVPASAMGYDLENARTIVSFGVPLLDGWGSPGRFTRLWAERAAGDSDPQLRLIQIEASLSRTAARAWRWQAVRHGSESALAAGLARVLMEERLVRAQGPMPQLTIAQVVEQTGISGDEIRDLARSIVARPPVIAIANGNDPSVAALNVVLGSVGSPGGIVRRLQVGNAYAPAEGDLGAARAVLIDSSVPWDFVPHTNAEVFRFAAWDGGSNKANWLLPAPGFLEDATDVPTAPASAVDTYAIATSLAKEPAQVQSAAQFLGSIDSGLPSTETIIHARCEDLFRRRIGNVHSQEITPVSKFDSAQKLEDALRSGAVWIGDPPRVSNLKCELKGWPELSNSAESATASSEWIAPVLPPLASKLFQESSLRDKAEWRTA